MKRYELSASQWRKIEGSLPGRPGSVGVTARDNRNFVDGVLWVGMSTSSGLFQVVGDYAWLYRGCRSEGLVGGYMGAAVSTCLADFVVCGHVFRAVRRLGMTVLSGPS